jgi:hypothetical protein
MITPANTSPSSPEPTTGRSVESAESWLGRNRTSKRRLWERLNPRHRKDLRMLAQALALQQNHARLPDPVRARLDSALAELDRLLRRIAAILAEVTRRTPPPG